MIKDIGYYYNYYIAVQKDNFWLLFIHFYYYRFNTEYKKGLQAKSSSADKFCQKELKPEDLCELCGLVDKLHKEGKL